jgi:hypothetical protein
MNSQDILQQLLAILEDNGIELRNEPLGGTGGGLCRVKGKNIFFVDTQAPAAETASLGAQAVGRLLDIETVYIRPEIREFIEKSLQTERREK